MPHRVFPTHNVNQWATAYNGINTWDFSQSNPLQWLNGPAGTGVCMSLACHWVKYHAEGDSLVNRLGGVWNRRHRYYIQFNHQEYNRLVRWQHRLAGFPNWIMGYQAWERARNNFNISTDYGLIYNVPT